MERSIERKDDEELTVEHVLKAGYDPVFWCFMWQKQILMMKMKFDKEKQKALIYDPPLEKWTDEIYKFINTFWSSLCEIQSIYTLLLGSAWEDKFIHLFLQDDEFLIKSNATLA